MFIFIIRIGKSGTVVKNLKDLKTCHWHYFTWLVEERPIMVDIKTSPKPDGGNYGQHNTCD